MWKDTTNSRDPLTRNGEWTWNQPWLEHSVNKGIACFTVRLDEDNLYECRFWHGNRGHSISVGSFKTKIEAMATCENHLRKIHEEIEKILEEING